MEGARRPVANGPGRLSPSESARFILACTANTFLERYMFCV